MKRIIILCLILSLLLLACVPTPEEEFVVNKADGTLEDKLSSEPVAEFTADPNTQEAAKNPLYDALGAPERWTMEPETRSVPFADLTIVADAEVVLCADLGALNGATAVDLLERPVDDAVVSVSGALAKVTLPPRGLATLRLAFKPAAGK